MISVRNVSKWFGDVVAVSDVSFEVGHGITALLGPNGAGKSTMLRMLCGLTPPSQGTVRVLDRPPRGDPRLYRRIGLVPQQEALFERLTGRQFVELAARLQRVARPRIRAEELLGVVDLDPSDKRSVAAYSKGMKQRVKVAAALVHDPEVIVLDEPLNGLDPRQRVHMVDVFRRLGAEGRCVLVSSHVLEEVERFGSRVLVLAEGRLAAEGDFRAIRDLMDDRPHRIRIRTDDPRGLASELLGAGSAVGVRIAVEADGAPGVLFVDTSDVTSFRRALAGLARARGIRIFEVMPQDDDLESVFRYLVSRRR